MFTPNWRQWLIPGSANRIAAAFARGLTPDGIGYVSVPPWSRPALRRSLGRHDVELDSTLLRIATQSVSICLTPLMLVSLRHALAGGAPVRTWRTRLLVAASHSSRGRRLLGSLVPGVGFVVRRPGARARFAWLSNPESASIDWAATVVQNDWRGKESAHLSCFPFGGAEPVVIGKVAPPWSDGDRPRLSEADLLTNLGPSAREAGARVPEVIAAVNRSGRPALLQTHLTGTPAADLLARNPRDLTSLLESIASWLERWSVTTAHTTWLTDDSLFDAILGPAEQLAPLLSDGWRYRSWLAHKCAAIAGTSVPLVATHNELSMGNVLIDDRHPLAVVDWETAKPHGLPLVDFFYAAVDAVAASQCYADRLDAFEQCFARKSPIAGAVAGWRSRLTRSVELTAPLDELSFHACWLYHAANEQREANPAGGYPFVRILDRVASLAHASDQGLPGDRS